MEVLIASNNLPVGVKPGRWTDSDYIMRLKGMLTLLTQLRLINKAVDAAVELDEFNMKHCMIRPDWISKALQHEYIDCVMHLSKDMVAQLAVGVPVMLSGTYMTGATVNWGGGDIKCTCEYDEATDVLCWDKVPVIFSDQGAVPSNMEVSVKLRHAGVLDLYASL